MQIQNDPFKTLFALLRGDITTEQLLAGIPKPTTPRRGVAMLVDKEKIDELRPEIDQTPEDSLSRRLLALIDESYRLHDEADIARTVNKLVHEHHHSREEAEQMAAAWKAGAPIETQWVKCSSCNGMRTWDYHDFPQCYSCGGKGEILQFLNPLKQ